MAPSGTRGGWWLRARPGPGWDSSSRGDSLAGGTSCATRQGGSTGGASCATGWCIFNDDASCATGWHVYIGGASCASRELVIIGDASYVARLWDLLLSCTSSDVRIGLIRRMRLWRRWSRSARSNMLVGTSHGVSAPHGAQLTFRCGRAVRRVPATSVSTAAFLAPITVFLFGAMADDDSAEEGAGDDVNDAYELCCQ
jgi:hypothetical protein